MGQLSAGSCPVQVMRCREKVPEWARPRLSAQPRADSSDSATAGVWVRVVRRVLALTAAIWHNEHTGQHVMRSLTTYDH